MGFVYIIGECEEGPVKIGHSHSPQKRKGNLQTGNPEQLHVFARIQCDDPEMLESMLHLHFASRHRRGEWFDVTAKDAAQAAKDYGYGNCGGDYEL